MGSLNELSYEDDEHDSSWIVVDNDVPLDILINHLSTNKLSE